MPARALAPAPRTVDARSAAAVPLAGLSAWQALFTHGGLRAGQRVLVHGGAGGVGMFVVQLAHDAGAHVSTTVRARPAGGDTLARSFGRIVPGGALVSLVEPPSLL
jgi:NADPH:quinone reductase-like Zn-dependent oxidoreductase